MEWDWQDMWTKVKDRMCRPRDTERKARQIVPGESAPPDAQLRSACVHRADVAYVSQHLRTRASLQWLWMGSHLHPAISPTGRHHPARKPPSFDMHVTWIVCGSGLTSQCPLCPTGKMSSLPAPSGADHHSLWSLLSLLP